jgi:hypothetical protein
VFLPWLFSVSRLTLSHASGSNTQTSAIESTPRWPASMFNTRAASLVTRASACTSGSFDSCAHFSVKGNNNSSPVAPGSDSSKGICFTSSSSGV